MQPAERGISPPTVAELDNKSILPQRLYTETRTVVQLNGLIKLQTQIDSTVNVNVLTV